ncbi:MAG TPA: class II aldolase/adducin family protein [Deltaproteobacteria bacterium]|nr:class II aldolase/adducin family protein [Deltaproteobacteria bacterium]
MKRVTCLIVTMVVLGLIVGTPMVFADNKTTTATVVKVGDGGKAITVKDKYTGKTITSKISAKRTNIFRGDNKIKADGLKAGDEIWITYWPNEKEGNEAFLIKTEPNIEKEKQKLIETICYASRIMANEGLMDFSGHISARIPNTDTFFIFPSQKGRDEYVPSDFCIVRVSDCKQIYGEMAVPQETVIHAAIYKARPEINSVIHTHGHDIILTTMVGAPFDIVCGHAAIFGGRVPVYPDAEKLTTWEQMNDVLKIMGNRRAVLLKGHGSIVAEESAEAATLAAFHLQENASLLKEILAIGKPTPLSKDEIKRAADNTYRPTSIEKSWIYFIDKGKRAKIFWNN